MIETHDLVAIMGSTQGYAQGVGGGTLVVRMIRRPSWGALRVMCGEGDRAEVASEWILLEAMADEDLGGGVVQPQSADAAGPKGGWNACAYGDMCKCEKV